MSPTEREAVEAEIRRLIATETRTVVLSNALFQQGTGLFGKLATTREERQVVSKSELFQAAQARVSELEYRDADALRAAQEIVDRNFPGLGLRVGVGDGPGLVS